jgi:hypothetical protein
VPRCMERRPHRDLRLCASPAVRAHVARAALVEGLRMTPRAPRLFPCGLRHVSQSSPAAPGRTSESGPSPAGTTAGAVHSVPGGSE